MLARSVVWPSVMMKACLMTGARDENRSSAREDKPEGGTRTPSGGLWCEVRWVPSLVHVVARVASVYCDAGTSRISLSLSLVVGRDVIQTWPSLSSSCLIVRWNVALGEGHSGWDPEAPSGASRLPRVRVTDRRGANTPSWEHSEQSKGSHQRQQSARSTGVSAAGNPSRSSLPVHEQRGWAIEDLLQPAHQGWPQEWQMR